MKPKSDWIVKSLALVAMLIAVPAFAASTSTAPTAIKRSSWQSLKKSLPGGVLLEGTYKGTGARTGDNYALHLLRYLDRTDSFIAVSEDLTKTHVALGFLQRNSNGSYDWYVLHVDETTGSELANPLLVPPVFNLSFVYEESGSLGRLLASNIVDGASENINFTKARSPLLHSDLRAGNYRQDATELNLVAGITANRATPDAGLLWTARVSKNRPSQTQMRNGTYLVREEYPGIFTFNVIKRSGYVSEVDPTISYVGVSFDDLGVFSDRTKFVVFQISRGGFLDPIANVLELDK